MSIPIEARIDLLSIAKLARYYQNKGRLVKSRSHLVQMTLQDFISALCNDIKMTSTEAVSILHDLGIGNSTRTRNQIIAELQKEVLTIEAEVLPEEAGKLLATLKKKGSL